MDSNKQVQICVQCTVYTIQFTLYNVYILHTVHCTLYAFKDNKDAIATCDNRLH